MGYQMNGAGAAGASLQFEDHLAGVDLGHNQGANPRGRLFYQFFRKRPDRFKLDEARANAFCPRIPDGLSG